MNNCAVCDHAEIEDFLTLRNMPTTVGAVWTDRAEAKNAPCADIVLSICRYCGCIANRAWTEELVSFVPGYEISLHHSGVYRRFIDETVRHLVDHFDLRKKQIIDVGCGQGYFLDQLCRVGKNDGFGFDPSVDQEQTHQIGTNTVRYIRGYYDERWSHLSPDFVCCRHVLQSSVDPKTFLRSIASAAGDRKTGYYFELPNAEYVFNPAIHWDIMFEYHFFFTPASLVTAFGLSGYDVMRSEACYANGQYLALEARRRPTDTPMKGIDQDGIAKMLDEIRVFGRVFSERLAAWRHKLARFESEGKKLLGWGAGGRGITFLCSLDVHGQIPYVVDINPSRQGGFLPRTGQEIVPPEFVKEYRPDVIIVTNPTYLEEIAAEVSAMGVVCEFQVI